MIQLHRNQKLREENGLHPCICSSKDRVADTQRNIPGIWRHYAETLELDAKDHVQSESVHMGFPEPLEINP